MRSLSEFRSGKPCSYPDQSVYAEYACAEFGLSFQDIDGGSGLLFRVASKTMSVHFGAGRCSWYPQNNATAATLASDKYFTNRILGDAGVATLGGEYFFLHERRRSHRAPGHEREHAFEYLRKLGGTAFAKPLLGSRGDFAQVIGGEVLIAHNEALRARGLSLVSASPDASLDIVLPRGERWEIPGRMNLSAGGTMVLEAPPSDAALTLARKAARALGLRVAAVDMFTDIGGEADAMRVIELNSNPSIRLLEESGRSELILKIWRHTFSAMGLL